MQLNRLKLQIIKRCNTKVKLLDLVAGMFSFVLVPLFDHFKVEYIIPVSPRNDDGAIVAGYLDISFQWYL